MKTFTEQVSAEIGNITDNLLGPIIVSKAKADAIVEATSVFTTEIKKPLMQGSEEVTQLESALAKALTDKHPGTDHHFYTPYTYCFWFSK